MGLDRRKHDFDVMERVLGDVHARAHQPQSEVVRFDVPWLGGTTVSVVQVTVLGKAGDDDPARNWPADESPDDQRS